METKKQSSKNGFYAALIGAILIAICCFTPILIVLFAAVGLSAFTQYLDYFLYPALVILIVIAWLSYRKYKRTHN